MRFFLQLVDLPAANFRFIIWINLLIFAFDIAFFFFFIPLDIVSHMNFGKLNIQTCVTYENCLRLPCDRDQIEFYLYTVTKIEQKHTISPYLCVEIDKFRNETFKNGFNRRICLKFHELWLGCIHVAYIWFWVFHLVFHFVSPFKRVFCWNARVWAKLSCFRYYRELFNTK